jgi:hypothetical protein
LAEPSEFLIPLLHSEIDSGLETKETCEMIRSRFLLFVKDDRLLDFPLPIINRIVNLDDQADHFDEIFGFLMRCLRQFGSAASILFQGLDMGRLKHWQLRELCDFEHVFIWFFCNESISTVISSLMSKVLEPGHLRQFWQTYDGQIGDLRQEIGQLHQRIAELDGSTNRRVASMTNKLRMEVQELRDVGLRRERACDDRFVAIEQRIDQQNKDVRNKLTALARQHRDENRQLEIGRTECERGDNDRLAALRRRLDGLNNDIDGRFGALAGQFRAENQQLKVDRLNRERAHDDRVAALEQRLDTLNRDTDGNLRTLREGIESKASKSDVELLRTSLVLQGNSISAIGDEAEEMSRFVTETLLSHENVPSRHKMQSFRFKSLEGCGGVISILRSREVQEMAGRKEGVAFHPHVILSQSSNDLIGFVDPESDDRYGSGPSGSNWIEFRFWRRIRINGLSITSSTRSFPRSFDICTGPRNLVVKSIRNADLNGASRVFVVNFGEVLTDQLKIKQKGPNWGGEQFFIVAKIEFLSPEPDYPNGVFRSLFSQHRANIRQYIQIRALDFDLEELHKPDNRTNVGTWDGDNCWVQVELVNAKFVTSCYRFKRSSNSGLRSWSLRGSNDVKLPLDQWKILDRHHEEREGQYDIFQLFPSLIGTFRYFRLVMEGPRWDGSSILNFKHIELYGSLISAV